MTLLCGGKWPLLSTNKIKGKIKNLTINIILIYESDNYYESDVVF